MECALRSVCVCVSTVNLGFFCISISVFVVVSNKGTRKRCFVRNIEWLRIRARGFTSPDLCFGGDGVFCNLVLLIYGNCNFTTRGPSTRTYFQKFYTRLQNLKLRKFSWIIDIFLSLFYNINQVRFPEFSSFIKLINNSNNLSCKKHFLFILRVKYTS